MCLDLFYMYFIRRLFTYRLFRYAYHFFLSNIVHFNTPRFCHHIYFHFLSRTYASYFLLYLFFSRHSVAATKITTNTSMAIKRFCRIFALQKTTTTTKNEVIGLGARVSVFNTFRILVNMMRFSY